MANRGMITVVRTENPFLRNSAGVRIWEEQHGDRYEVTGFDMEGHRVSLPFMSWNEVLKQPLSFGSRWLVRRGRRWLIQRVEIET